MSLSGLLSENSYKDKLFIGDEVIVGRTEQIQENIQLRNASGDVFPGSGELLWQKIGNYIFFSGRVIYTSLSVPNPASNLFINLPTQLNNYLPNAGNKEFVSVHSVGFDWVNTEARQLYGNVIRGTTSGFNFFFVDSVGFNRSWTADTLIDGTSSIIFSGKYSIE
jgi:hypothetical protein